MQRAADERVDASARSLSFAKACQTFHFGAKDIVRPLSVRAADGGLSALEVFTARHPHLGQDHWTARFLSGAIYLGSNPVLPSRKMRPGEVLLHHVHGYREPKIATNVEWIHEDAEILVVNKPAPLPVHASGRFVDNTLSGLLKHAFPEEVFRPAHRLDAATTGVIVLAKSKDAASRLQNCFQERQVTKTYLAKVIGRPSWKHHRCERAIGLVKIAGGRRGLGGSTKGAPAETHFKVLSARVEETLLEAIPITGRTNQIRLHLAQLGYPIVGDTAYLDAAGTKDSNRKRTIADDPFADTLVSTDTLLCLHALRLEFTTPEPWTSAKVFSSRLPDWAVSV